MYAVGRVSLSSSKYNTVVLVSLLSRVFLFLAFFPPFLTPGFLRMGTMSYSSLYSTYPHGAWHKDNMSSKWMCYLFRINVESQVERPS